MITGISGFCFWGPKMAVSLRICFFRKIAETPIFIVIGGARFLGQVVQKGNFGHPPKKDNFDW